MISRRPVKSNTPSDRYGNKGLNHRMMVSGSKMFQMRKPLAREVFSSLGYKSIAGMSEGVSKLNQDSVYVETRVLQDPNICLLGVMDGHGMQGHRVSGFLRLNINSKILIFLGCFLIVILLLTNISSQKFSKLFTTTLSASQNPRLRDNPIALRASRTGVGRRKI